MAESLTAHRLRLYRQQAIERAVGNGFDIAQHAGALDLRPIPFYAIAAALNVVVAVTTTAVIFSEVRKAQKAKQ